MSESSESKKSASKRLSAEKHHSGKFLRELREALRHSQHWRYQQLSPVKLLQRSNYHKYPPDTDELTRANWFWSRQPRWHHAASCALLFIVALGLPLWLFMFPAIGAPLIVITAVISNTGIVRSVRWRRQYELSIDRLIGTCKNGRDTFGIDFFA
jgi:hypothetical protein